MRNYNPFFLLFFCVCFLQVVEGARRIAEIKSTTQAQMQSQVLSLHLFYLFSIRGPQRFNLLLSVRAAAVGSWGVVKKETEFEIRPYGKGGVVGSEGVKRNGNYESRKVTFFFSFSRRTPFANTRKRRKSIEIPVRIRHPERKK